MENQKFKYSAFISYKHLDKKDAAFVQRKLENYRLPTKLCKEYGLHNKLKKCFRDVDDLAGTVLKDAILEEMKQCKFMILICSPNVNIDAEYINYEVEEFRKLRGDEYIIPVIIDGAPDDDDPRRKCFPDALTKTGVEHLGISFEQDGKNKAILKIIATILGVSADAIIMREQRRTIQKRITLTVFTACFLVLTAVTLNYYLPKSADFINYVVQDGVPKGVGELSGTQVKNLSGHFTITYKNAFDGFNFLSTYPQYEVRYENNKNVLIQPVSLFYSEEKAPRIVYTFLQNGEYRAEYYTTSGQMTKRLAYSMDKLVADLKNTEHDSVYATLSADATGQEEYDPSSYLEEKSDIARYGYEYNEDGFATKIFYYKDNRNTPVPDVNGVYGLEYVLDENGLITQAFYLDENKQRMILPNGAAYKTYTYNDEYQLVKYETINFNGETIYANIDEWISLGNFNSIYNFDKGTDSINTLEIMHNNDTGNIEKLKAWGYSSNSETLNVCFEYEEGYNVKTWRVDNNDELLNEYIVNEFDENGRIETVSRLNENEEQVERLGYCFVKYEYDNMGSITKEAYFGKENEPVLSYGEHAIEYKYDEDNRLTQQVLLDTNLKPITAERSSYSYRKFSYDEYGNIAAVSYYDENENPHEYYDCYIKKYIFNESGNLQREEYFDENSEPVKEEFAVQYTYENTFDLVNEKHFNSENELYYLKGEGYAEIDYEYYDNGLLKSEQYYDAFGEATLLPENYEMYSKKEYIYNEVGLPSELRYYGTDGKLALNGMGFAVEKIKYDEFGREIENSYFGTDEQAVIYHGYHTEKLTYNENGRTVSEEYYDVNGNKMLRYDNYFKAEYIYDEDGNKIQENYYDTNGKLIAKDNYYGVFTSIKFEYDENGNKISEFYYDENNEMVLNALEMYAGVRYEYNQDGDVVKETFYGTDNKPLMSENFYAAVKTEYDNNGNKIRIEYIDEKGQLTNLRNGYAFVLYEYNTNGDKTYEAYFDENEKPVNKSINQNFASASYNYDENGNILEEMYFAQDGSLVVAKSEDAAVISYEYDVRGNNTVQYFYNEKNELLASGDYAFVKKEFNDDDKLLSMAFFNENEEATIQSDAKLYHKVIYEYNDEAIVVKTAYFDVNGMPCAIDEYSNYHYIVNELDDFNNIAQTTYFDVNGNATVASEFEPWHKITYEYNKNNYLAQEMYLDVDDNPIVSHELELPYKIIYNYSESMQIEETGFYYAVSENTAEHIVCNTKFNVDDLVIQTAYYDIMGNAVENNNGYSKVVFEYDKYDDITKQAYYGTDELLIDGPEGYALYEQIFTQEGYLESEKYYAQNGTLLPLIIGNYYGDIIEQYAYEKKEYNENGDVIAKYYYDVNDNLVVNNYYAYITYNLDEQGRIIGEKYYGASAEPVPNYTGAYERKLERDEFNNITAEYFYGADGQPMLLEFDGYASIKTEYNIYGNVVKETFYGLYGEQVNHANHNYSLVLYTYDKYQNIIEEEYFGADGLPTLHIDNYHIVQYKYDERNVLYETAYFGTDNKPIMYKGDEYAVLSTINSEGESEITYYDTQGNVI